MTVQHEFSSETPPVSRLIAAFGGLSATSRALGHRHPTTVQGWEKSGRIPQWRRSEIENAAEKCAVELPDDLLNLCIDGAERDAA